MSCGGRGIVTTAGYILGSSMSIEYKLWRRLSPCEFTSEKPGFISAHFTGRTWRDNDINRTIRWTEIFIRPLESRHRSGWLSTLNDKIDQDNEVGTLCTWWNTGGYYHIFIATEFTHEHHLSVSVIKPQTLHMLSTSTGQPQLDVGLVSGTRSTITVREKKRFTLQKINRPPLGKIEKKKKRQYFWQLSPLPPPWRFV